MQSENGQSLKDLALQLRDLISLEIPARSSPLGLSALRVNGLLGQQASTTPLITQMLPDILPWTWATPSIGTTPPEAYSFLDLIPASGGDSYSATKDSFSSNYRLFLNLLNNVAYPDHFGLEAALKANCPRFVGPDLPLPLGWTRVTDVTGIQVSQPGWLVSSYPYQWIGDESQVTPLSLDLINFDTVISSGQKDFPIARSMVTRFNISATRWGTISVSPGAWFDSSIMTYAVHAEGPYKDPTWNNSKSFGPNGLLPRRVAQFVAALDPKLDLEVDSVALKEVPQLDAIRVASFRFDTAIKESSVHSSILATQMDSVSSRIEATARRLSGHQAFIIAVGIESMV